MGLEGIRSMIEALSILTTTMLGLFAGSLLTEALLLVPFFRSLSFEEFNRLHHDFGPRLYRFYAPLTITATSLPFLAAVAITVADTRLWMIACAPAALCLLILATYVFYFQHANRAFAEKRLDAPALAKELTRWAAVHNFRTVLSIAAFVISLLATLQISGGAPTTPAW